MKIVEIKWRDSQLYLTQCSVDDDFDYCVLVSYGAVVSEDKDKIVLAGDLVDDDVRRVIVIPKENIVSKKVLCNRLVSN